MTLLALWLGVSALPFLLLAVSRHLSQHAPHRNADLDRVVRDFARLRALASFHAGAMQHDR